MAIMITGADEVLDGLEDICKVSKIEKQLKKACALVEGEARKKAPKVDGLLRNSITSRVEDGLTGVVYTPLYYAPYVEYGTGLFATGEGGGRTDVPWVYKDAKTGEFIQTNGQHPQPYLRPALDENKQDIVDILSEALRKK